MRVLLGLLLLATSVAHADDRVATARAEAAAAESLAASQNYGAAAAKFRAAYRLDPSAGYLCNVGVAYQRAKDLPRARLYLSDCERKGQALDAAFLGLVGKALEDVDAKLRAGDFAPVAIAVTPANSVLSINTFDADETFVGSQVVWLPFGTHTIEAIAENHERVKRTVSVTSRMPVEVRFELPRARPPQASAAPVASPPAALASKVGLRRSRILAIAATAVTVTTGVAALGTFVHARSLIDDAASTTIDRGEYDARIGRARSWQHVSWGLAGVAGVGAIVSTVLWARSSSSNTVEVRATDGGGAASLSGRW